MARSAGTFAQLQREGKYAIMKLPSGDQDGAYHLPCYYWYCFKC
jgi:ribosomal protein L2